MEIKQLNKIRNAQLDFIKLKESKKEIEIRAINGALITKINYGTNPEHCIKALTKKGFIVKK